MLRTFIRRAVIYVVYIIATFLTLQIVLAAFLAEHYLARITIGLCALAIGYGSYIGITRFNQWLEKKLASIHISRADQGKWIAIGFSIVATTLLVLDLTALIRSNQPLVSLVLAAAFAVGLYAGVRVALWIDREYREE